MQPKVADTRWFFIIDNRFQRRKIFREEPLIPNTLFPRICVSTLQRSGHRSVYIKQREIIVWVCFEIEHRHNCDAGRNGSIRSIIHRVNFPIRFFNFTCSILQNLKHRLVEDREDSGINTLPRGWYVGISVNDGTLWKCN